MQALSTFTPVKDLNTFSPCRSGGERTTRRGKRIQLQQQKAQSELLTPTLNQELKGLQCSLLRCARRYFHSAAFHLLCVTGAQALAYDDIVVGA